MKNRILTTLAFILCMSTFSAHAAISVGVVFTDTEVRIISSWYHEHGGSAQKGHGKKSKGLPPGIAKNLQNGKPLPPGIAKQYLPDGLTRALPAPPNGYERIIVDGKVLLVEIATHVIHDILSDILLD